MAHTHSDRPRKSASRTLENDPTKVSMSDHKSLMPLQTARRMDDGNTVSMMREPHADNPSFCCSRQVMCVNWRPLSCSMGSGLHSKLHNFFDLQFAD